MAKDISTDGWNVLPGEEILSTEERRLKYADRQVDDNMKCARPGCESPLWIHDTNAGVPGGACLHGCGCPQFIAGIV